jgi:hypothetical protein
LPQPLFIPKASAAGASNNVVKRKVKNLREVLAARSNL